MAPLLKDVGPLSVVDVEATTEMKLLSKVKVFECTMSQGVQSEVWTPCSASLLSPATN